MYLKRRNRNFTSIYKTEQKFELMFERIPGYHFRKYALGKLLRLFFLILSEH